MITVVSAKGTTIMSAQNQVRQQPTGKSKVEVPLEPMAVRIPVAIQLTGIGRSKLYELIRAGELETVKIGTATLVKVPSLRRLVQEGSA